MSRISDLAAQKHWDKAANELETFRQAHPKSVSAAILQSEILIHLSLFSDANQILQRVIAVNSHSIEALSAYSELYGLLETKQTPKDY